MLIVLIIIVMISLVGFITDWLWFKEMGYAGVFWKKIVTQLELGIPIFVIVALLVRLYLRTLRNGYFKKVESHEIPDLKKLKIISWSFSLIFGVVTAFFATGRIWFDFLKYTNSTNFNLTDPLFNKDISFYIFKLDFLTKLNDLSLAIIIGLIVITLLYYSVLLTSRTPDGFDDNEPGESGQGDNEIPFNRGSKPGNSKIFGSFNKGTFNPRGPLDDRNLAQLMNIASVRVSLLGIVFYIMVGADFFLKQYTLLQAHTGAVYGAGFTDVNITLWIYRGIILLAGIGAVTFYGQIKKAEFKKIIRVPAAMVILGILGIIAAAIVQSLIVSPDEINKETQYLNSNIEFTKHAYGLDNINVQTFSADATLTSEDIADNAQTITNIRINDYSPVQKFYNQTQSIRQYYDFNDVDVDRYIIDGQITQTFLSAREINEEKISSTWLNTHIKYTHGYGITMSRVDTVTSSGQPDVIIKNIPPESSVEEFDITQPEIYFGELSNDYIIVKTDEKEFDYPDGNNNKYVTYAGNAGIKLSFFNKLLFSIREGSMKLLVSSNVNSNSRIVINRNIMDRVKTIMPYLSYGEDPYIVTVNGKLYWMLDAYTTSSNYPYSEPYTDESGTTNYIRNSIKVVVDAYNGDVSYYIVDDEDPIAQTYKSIYPSLFKDIDQMPEGLKEHIRYPNELFEKQAKMYTKYHMNEAKVFYQNEDLWDIANQISGTEEAEMKPSYFIFKLPGEDKAEFVNSIPFTPMSKQNMTALMVARNDDGHYGELVVYKFPKSKTVYGPMQIEAQIDQNTEISKEFSLWNSAGSSYSRGDLFVIPIGSSLLYVEPVYLEASNQAIPEVKRVIVAYDNQIAYKPTLTEALVELFGEDIGLETATTTDSGTTDGGEKTQTELIALANESYDAAIAAQKDGNWTEYGTQIDQLQEYLNSLVS